VDTDGLYVRRKGTYEDKRSILGRNYEIVEFVEGKDDPLAQIVRTQKYRTN
jgi:hypothetical protein